jgi:hypothetical protein
MNLGDHHIERGRRMDDEKAVDGVGDQQDPVPGAESGPVPHRGGQMQLPLAGHAEHSARIRQNENKPLALAYVQAGSWRPSQCSKDCPVGEAAVAGHHGKAVHRGAGPRFSDSGQGQRAADPADADSGLTMAIRLINQGYRRDDRGDSRVAHDKHPRPDEPGFGGVAEATTGCSSVLEHKYVR